jgi:hypothetical protein
VHTSTAPASWSAVGRSLSTTAASRIEAAGWSSNSSDDSAAGSRGSDEVIRSHPAVWLVMANSSSQPNDGQLMPSCQPPNSRPSIAAPAAHLRVTGLP